MTQPPKQNRQLAGTDVRWRAMEALVAVDQGVAGSQAAVRQALDQKPELHGPDRGLVTELIYGVVRRQRALDAWIAQGATRGLFEMDPVALAALRLGAYQLAEMPRIPDFAAVDATVQACKAGLNKHSVGFVHAVLRNLAAQKRHQETALGDDLPAWLNHRIDRFAQRLHLDNAALHAAMRAQAPLHVSIPTRDPSVAEELLAQGVPLEALPVPGTYASSGGSLFQSEAFAQRRALAQDAGSAAIVRWIDAQPGMHVADLAAGRGIKSLGLAAAGAEVTAVDLQATRLVDAQALANTAGYPLAQVLAADLSQPIDLPKESFDVVLLDAPCSALGTLRRRPEVRHRRSAADLMRLNELQQKMAHQAAQLVRPGGLLVMATCSLAEEEGPLLFGQFLIDHTAFSRDSGGTSGERSWVQPLLDDQGDFASHPLCWGMDIFQATRLRKAV